MSLDGYIQKPKDESAKNATSNPNVELTEHNLRDCAIPNSNAQIAEHNFHDYAAPWFGSYRGLQVPDDQQVDQP